MDTNQILSKVDLAILKPNLTKADLRKAWQLATDYSAASLCVPSVYVQDAFLQRPLNTSLAICSVVGFPSGLVSTELKREEMKEAIRDGATEIDFVGRIDWLKQGRLGAYEQELHVLAELAYQEGATTKVILEICYLTDEEIAAACKAAVKTGIHYVKTSTGFGPSGANFAVVQLMLDTVKGTGVKVKASGGIKTREAAVRYLEMGCERLGVGSIHPLLDYEHETNERY